MTMTDRKPIAVYPLSNWGGVEILDIIYGIDDAVAWRYYYQQEGVSKIEYEYGAEDVRSFFKIGEIKIYLDECMRV